MTKTQKILESNASLENWQINAIKSAVKIANSKDAKFIDHDKVTNWLNSWGEADEENHYTTLLSK